MKKLFGKLTRFGAAFALSISSLLVINVGAAFATAPNTYTCSWTGGGDGTSFNDAANWGGGNVPDLNNCNGTSPVPSDYDHLIFDNTVLANSPGTATLDNNLVNLQLMSITFQGNGSRNFAITGNDMTVSVGITNSMTGCTSDSCYETIANNITFSGAASLTVPTGGTATAFLEFTGDLSGSGLVTVAGDNGGVWLEGNNSSLTGGITSSAASISAFNGSALGTGTTTISGTATLYPTFNSNTTFANSLSLGGTGDFLSGAALYMTSPDNNPAGDGTTATWSGPITLTSNVKVGGFGNRIFKITGPLSGNFAITPATDVSNGVILNQSSNNTSKTETGNIPVRIAAGDNQPGTNYTIDNLQTYIIDGTRGNVTVQSGGTLMGSGTVGTLGVQSGGTVAPGHSPGCLNTGNLTQGGTYQAEIGGTTACTGYDQLKVTGTVDLTNGTLNTSLYNGFKPAAGDSFTIIDNDASDAVTGNFTNLPEGATFTVSGYVFQISYVGGDGNDVELTVQSVPATPDTGFSLITSNPLLSAAGALMAAGGFYALYRKKAFATTRR